MARSARDEIILDVLRHASNSGGSPADVDPLALSARFQTEKRFVEEILSEMEQQGLIEIGNDPGRGFVAVRLRLAGREYLDASPNRPIGFKHSN